MRADVASFLHAITPCVASSVLIGLDDARKQLNKYWPDLEEPRKVNSLRTTKPDNPYKIFCFDFKVFVI